VKCGRKPNTNARSGYEEEQEQDDRRGPLHSRGAGAAVLAGGRARPAALAGSRPTPADRSRPEQNERAGGRDQGHGGEVREQGAQGEGQRGDQQPAATLHHSHEEAVESQRLEEQQQAVVPRVLGPVDVPGRDGQQEESRPSARVVGEAPEPGHEER
jgi:hypothetical protein